MLACLCLLFAKGKKAPVCVCCSQRKEKAPVRLCLLFTKKEKKRQFVCVYCSQRKEKIANLHVFVVR